MLWDSPRESATVPDQQTLLHSLAGLALLDKLCLNAAMLQVEPQQHVQLPFRMLQLQSLQPKHIWCRSVQTVSPCRQPELWCAAKQAVLCWGGWPAWLAGWLTARLTCSSSVTIQWSVSTSSDLAAVPAGQGRGVAQRVCLPPCARLPSSCAQQHAGVTTSRAQSTCQHTKLQGANCCHSRCLMDSHSGSALSASFPCSSADARSVKVSVATATSCSTHARSESGHRPGARSEAAAAECVQRRPTPLLGVNMVGPACYFCCDCLGLFVVLHGALRRPCCTC